MRDGATGDRIDGVRACESSRAGFTLLELMVVMTLLVVMSLTVTPVFRSSFSGVRADHAMRDLFAAMKSAQSAAVTEAVEYRVYFAPEENRYWTKHAVRTFDGVPEFRVLDDRAHEAVVLPDSLLMERPRARRGLEKGSYYVAFFPSGACDIVEVTVALSGDPRQLYRIETTGTRVRLELPES